MSKSARRWTIGLVLVVGMPLAVWLAFRPQQLDVRQPLPAGKVQPQIGLLARYAVLLAPDGSLWGWGGGPGTVQYPIGSITNSRVPHRIGRESDWAKIACGEAFVVALKVNGTLWGWGWNASGSLMTNVDRILAPTRLDDQDSWHAIAAGVAHCVALKEDGSLWCWGRNNNGQLGDGSTTDSHQARMISETRNWRKVWASDYASWALREDGALFGWGFRLGSNGGDQVTPKEMPSAVPWKSISAGGVRLLGVKTDGTLWLIPQYPHVGIGRYETVQLGTSTNWQHVVCGPNYFFGQDNDQTWWAYGANDYGQIGDGTRYRVAELSRVRFRFDPSALGLGETTTVLLTSDGALWSWGVRLGSDFHPNRFPKVKNAINGLAARLPWKVTIFKHNPWPIDFEPTKIWSIQQAD